MGNTFTYTGREWDEEAGLYYYRARYYDPEVGRFIGKDPIGFAGGDVNLYGYVGNNPVNWVDPWGLSRADVLKLLEESKNYTDQQTSFGARTDPGTINNLLMTCAFLRICEENSFNGCQAQADSLKKYLERYMKGDKNGKPLDDIWTIKRVYNLPFHWNLRARSSNPNDPVLVLDPHSYEFYEIEEGSFVVTPYGIQ